MPATAYHGTPITPFEVLESVGPRDLCVSFYRPDQDAWADEHARSWFGDNGVFSLWMAALRAAKVAGTPFEGVTFGNEYLDRYYAWCRRWCLEGSGRCKWVVIPDPIGTSTQELDALIREWPAEMRDYGVPVYHLGEPISRCVDLLRRRTAQPPPTGVPWVCIGATDEFAVIGSPAFCDRMDALFCAIFAEFGFIPPTHMFRGLQLLKAEFDWPIATADSTDRGRNHNRLKVYGERYLWAVKQSFDRWDNLAARRTQLWPPSRLIEQPSIFGEAA